MLDGKPKETMTDLGIDERIILHCILTNGILRCGMDSFRSECGSVADSCEHGNETSGSIKGGEFLDSGATVTFPSAPCVRTSVETTWYWSRDSEMEIRCSTCGAVALSEGFHKNIQFVDHTLILWGLGWGWMTWVSSLLTICSVTNSGRIFHSFLSPSPSQNIRVENINDAECDATHKSTLGSPYVTCLHIMNGKHARSFLSLRPSVRPSTYFISETVQRMKWKSVFGCAPNVLGRM
jgi:hypothetical protein